MNSRNGMKIWGADLGDGTYRNPILFADYSDPDVIRAGDDFFMVASSFCNTPAIPVLHSKDLVNWELVNYVLDRIPYEDYEKPAHGRGVWAPAIRYHDNKYWVFFPMPDEGIFVSTATDPFGKWTEPAAVREGKGWIDPCPFWDDDGSAYLVNAFAKSRIGFKSILHVSRMKPDGTGLLDEGRHVFDGNLNHKTIEGPKLYKRNGYYYIFAPAGGVETGWQTVLRSRSIFGPYEDKIVLHQGDTSVNGPHQGALVELETGESWFVHFQDAGAYGRIVHLEPVKWINDWPVMGEDFNSDGIGEPVIIYKKPDVGKNYPVTEPATSDEFNDGKLGLQWQWNANHHDEWYSLSERKGFLRLYPYNRPVGNTARLCDVPNLLLQKFPAPDFVATTRMEFKAVALEEAAGLIIQGAEYSALAMTKMENGYKLIQIRGINSVNEGREWEVCSMEMDCSPLYLRVIVDEGAVCSFCYSKDGDRFEEFGEKFAAKPGIWVGAKMGLFHIGDGNGHYSGIADFDWFRVERKENDVL